MSKPDARDELEAELNELAGTAAIYGENSARTVARIKGALKEADTYAQAVAEERVREVLDVVIQRQVNLAGGANAYTNIVADEMARLAKQDHKEEK